MECQCKRVAHIHGKCSDMSSVEIPHLNLEHDGYMLDIGVGGGDYIEFSVCLDCGKIQNWKPISDKDILSLDEFLNEDDDELSTVQNEDGCVEPITFSLVDVEMQRISKLMTENFGPLWTTDPEALEILQTTLERDNCGEALTEAIKRYLNGR